LLFVERHKQKKCIIADVLGFLVASSSE
jgi:hypothetical protein